MSFPPTTKVVCIGEMILGSNSLILAIINLVITLYTVLHKLIGSKTPQTINSRSFWNESDEGLFKVFRNLTLFKNIDSPVSNQKH